MGINAHIPRTPRFVIGVRASARHISASLSIPDGLRVTFTPQTFVKEVIHATGQADILVTSRVALRPTILYGLTACLSVPVTGLP